MLLSAFGAMPPGAAVAIWAALNLFCLFRAGELLGARMDLALLACAAPATLIMVASGYPGGFLALMATIVFTQGRARPGLAGLCLALMTVHPQLALLLALLLLPTGYWRAIAVAIPWTLALLAASVISFGLEPWTNFLQAATTQPSDAISLYAGARMATLPEWAAQALQWSVGFAMLASASVMLARRGPEPRSIASMLLATILALPDASASFLALAAPALTLALFADDSDKDRTFLPFVPALLWWIMPILAPVFGAPLRPVVAAAAATLLLYAVSRELAVPGPLFAADKVRQ
jgi:hypothetical protein